MPVRRTLSPQSEPEPPSIRQELYVPLQTILEGLTLERAGTPFLLQFPEVIPEQPNVGRLHRLASLSLVVTHSVTLKTGQEEAFPSVLQCSLHLLRNDLVVGVWEVGFQMRLTPGTEGKQWTGEASIYQDLTNPVDYRSGDALSFAISGVIPGNIGGPQLTKQEEREIESLQTLIEIQAETGAIGEAQLVKLEEILARLFEME
jgi:hypothetical protein